MVGICLASRELKQPPECGDSFSAFYRLSLSIFSTTLCTVDSSPVSHAAGGVRSSCWKLTPPHRCLDGSAEQAPASGLIPVYLVFLSMHRLLRHPCRIKAALPLQGRRKTKMKSLPLARWMAFGGFLETERTVCSWEQLASQSATVCEIVVQTLER